MAGSRFKCQSGLFDEVVARCIHPVQEGVRLARRKELIDGQAATVVGAVVVDDDEAAIADLIVHMVQADLCRRIPVAVQPKDRDWPDFYCRWRFGVFAAKTLRPIWPLAVLFRDDFCRAGFDLARRDATARITRRDPLP